MSPQGWRSLEGYVEVVDSDFVRPLTNMPPTGVWGAILLLLLTRGPGVFSVDHVLSRSAQSHRRTR